MYVEFSQSAPIVFGRGAVSILGARLQRFGCKKALIICEKGIEDAGIVAKAVGSLDASGIEYAVFNGVLADPPDTVVDEAGKLALEVQADCIVGLGGGSSLDTAKASSILITNPGPARNYITAPPYFHEPKVPIILIPTTAGTGSESTTVAIISLPDKNVKSGVFVKPTLAIIDPELMLTLPRSITANTGMDAFAHAAEAITNLMRNPHSDLYAEGAIKKISNNLLKCCETPDDIEARSEMALAANWAALAFNVAVCHVGHAVADAFSGCFHTPHGLNCALALPETMALVSTAVPDCVRTVANAMSLPLNGEETAEQLGKLVADGIRGLMKAIGIPSLKEMGHSREKIVALVPDVLSNHLSTFCPVKIDEESAAKLLGDIYDTYQ